MTYHQRWVLAAGARRGEQIAGVRLDLPRGWRRATRPSVATRAAYACGPPRAGATWTIRRGPGRPDTGDSAYQTHVRPGDGGHPRRGRRGAGRRGNFRVVLARLPVLEEDGHPTGIITAFRHERAPKYDP
jgi:hypothetical protein